MRRHDANRVGFRRCLLAGLTVAGCHTAHRTPQMPSRSRTATVLNAAEIVAIANKPDTAIAFDSLAMLTNVRDEYAVAVAVVRRQRVGDVTPPDALAHHEITEVYQILEGSGEFVSGGRIVGGAEMAPTTRGVRYAVGPSFRGTQIEGGQARIVQRGDVIIVPPDTPHGFVRLISARIVYTVVRVDPNRLLQRPNGVLH